MGAIVSSSENKKHKYVKSEEKKEDKKVDEKKREMSKVKCYLLNDYDDVGKLREKGDIGVFVGYLKEFATFIVSAMQDEFDQFARLKVWRLVPRPEGKTVIKTKWIFKNKKDESSLVIRNKAWLVDVGYYQHEGIDYDETFAPVAPIEAIHLCLAYAAHKDFMVFLIDVRRF
uniref:Reverse transcriptase Ty1/copia-type domain-containing protein n=1 Tax=Tanacetum cinerariifolium TaxID=118510 RepID=A0A6L2JDT6_TANCI|nr:hypothetical protein [Tanacetum cinerariifolium]